MSVWLQNWSDLLPEWLLWAIVPVAACVAGASLGWERELKGKPAGLKTMMLISVGAAIFARLSSVLADGRADITRIAAQVVPGIGFLGAGAILRERGAVIGLTTAATIWVSAALGMVIGGGYVAVGLLLAPLVMLLYHAGIWVEHEIEGPCHLAPVDVVLRGDPGTALARIRLLLDETGTSVAMTLERGTPTSRLHMQVCSRHRHHRRFLGALAELPQVSAFEGEGVQGTNGGS